MHQEGDYLMSIPAAKTIITVSWQLVKNSQFTRLIYLSSSSVSKLGMVGYLSGQGLQVVKYRRVLVPSSSL